MGLLSQNQNTYYGSGNSDNYGDYQFTSLDSIINGFMVAYVGESKLINKVNRTDVQFHAMRGIQEFSYDILKSVKAQEIEVPNTLQMILPQDYVNYSKITTSGNDGIERVLYPTGKTSNPFAITQLDDGAYDFNQTNLRKLTITCPPAAFIPDGKYLDLKYIKPNSQVGTMHFIFNKNSTFLDGDISNITDQSPKFFANINGVSSSTDVASKLKDAILESNRFNVSQSGNVLTVEYKDVFPASSETFSFDFVENSYVNFHSSGVTAVADASTRPISIVSSNSISFDDTVLEQYGFVQDDAQGLFTTDPGGVGLDSDYLPNFSSPASSTVLIQGRVTKNDGSGDLYSDVDNDGFIQVKLSGNAGDIIDIGIHTSSSKTNKVDAGGYFNFTHTMVADAGIFSVSAADISSTSGDPGVLISGLAIGPAATPTPIVVTNTGATSTSDNLQYQAESDTWTNYKSHTPNEIRDDYETDGNYIDHYGRRYGLDPQHSQDNGTFYIDTNKGLIHFGSALAGSTVVLHYISDGLGTDAEMVVHKFAEEAIYKWIAYGVLASRSNIPEYIVQRFKKERFAEARKAKIRLSSIKIEEFTQVLKGLGKPIK
ncbi:hypothetical protein N9121_00885 [Pseudomonadales bacterium]|nr:hypothetical protein [Pseudomonadales bacterium]